MFPAPRWGSLVFYVITQVHHVWTQRNGVIRNPFLFVSTKSSFAGKPETSSLAISIWCFKGTRVRTEVERWSRIVGRQTDRRPRPICEYWGAVKRIKLLHLVQTFEPSTYSVEVRLVTVVSIQSVRASYTMGRQLEKNSSFSNYSCLFYPRLRPILRQQIFGCTVAMELEMFVVVPSIF